MITVRFDEKAPNLLAVFFPTNTIANDLIRKIPGRRWSYSRRCWLVPNTREAVVQIGHLFGKDYCRFDEAVIRLYKPAATSAEVEQATNPAWPPVRKQIDRKLFRYVPLLQLTKLAYQKYLLFLVDKKHLSSSTLNVHINAYKFYCDKVLQRAKEFYDIEYPRQPTKLPTVYSVAEVKAILMPRLA